MKNIINIILFLLFALSLHAQSEAEYISTLNDQHFHGRTEVKMYGGIADIVTNTHAIEVERASKWKNAIGQSLWYAQQLELQAGIVIIIESKSEFKYVQMLNSTLAYAGLKDKIKVWMYPDDFPSVATRTTATPLHSTSLRAAPATNTKSYWLSTNSNKRHNSTCRWYKNSRGKACPSTQGTACKICGG